MSIPSDDLHHHDSDSDTVSEAPGDDYHPISAADSDGEDDDPPPADGILSNGRRPSDSGEIFPNGVGDGEDAAAEEEEEKRMAAADRSASQAFREDEERRAAPLTPENAARVVEAMRGIAFPGAPPDWAGRVSEDRWMDQLRRLREP